MVQRGGYEAIQRELNKRSAPPPHKEDLLKRARNVKEKLQRRWKYFKNEVGHVLRGDELSEYERMVEKARILKLNRIFIDSSGGIQD